MNKKNRLLVLLSAGDPMCLAISSSLSDSLDVAIKLVCLFRSYAKMKVQEGRKVVGSEPLNKSLSTCRARASAF